jgi:hypothetical protein
MSPRRHRRRADAVPPELDQERVRRGLPVTHTDRDGDWAVRQIPGGAADKTYRCPGCDQLILPGTAHVVAWPVDGRGGTEERRHWHGGCWQARHRRGPGVERSRNAPRYG